MPLSTWAQSPTPGTPTWCEQVTQGTNCHGSPKPLSMPLGPWCYVAGWQRDPKPLRRPLSYSPHVHEACAPIGKGSTWVRGCTKTGDAQGSQVLVTGTVDTHASATGKQAACKGTALGGQTVHRSAPKPRAPKIVCGPTCAGSTCSCVPPNDKTPLGAQPSTFMMLHDAVSRSRSPWLVCT